MRGFGTMFAFPSVCNLLESHFHETGVNMHCPWRICSVFYRELYRVIEIFKLAEYSGYIPFRKASDTLEYHLIVIFLCAFR